MFTIDEILDIAIRLEKNGEAVYRQAIDKVSNPELSEMLTWMADEEVCHARWFSDLKDNAQTRTDEILSEEISAGSLSGVIGEQSFSLKDIDFSRIENLSELLDIFIEFESDSILFYEMLLPFIRIEKTRKLLEQIVAEEKRHIRSLKNFTVAVPEV